jgi:HSP20 family protein
MAEPSWRPGVADPWTFDSLCWRLGELVRDAGSAAGSHRALPVDVAETDDGYVVEIELPGISTGDVRVDVIGNEIRVRGEIRPRDSPGKLRYHTRRVGSFDNQVALPSQVDARRTEATLADGVLTVRAPKAESSESRGVEVVEVTVT